MRERANQRDRYCYTMNKREFFEILKKYNFIMKWIAITGNLRKTNEKVENDVRLLVREVLLMGNGIVIGGVLNVDYFVTDEVLRQDPLLEKLKIFLPTNFDDYVKDYQKRAKKGIISQEQAEHLIHQLEEVRKNNPHVLIENKKNTIINQKTYFARNGEMISASDELYAFQVNTNEGTQDMVEKAEKKGIQITVYAYNIE